MIQFFLTVVGLAALAYVAFIWGINHAVHELYTQAPDLLAEWKRRRDAGEVRK